MDLQSFKDLILPKLQSNYSTCIIDDQKSDANVIVLRVDLSQEDVEKFKQIFSQITSTEWNVYHGKSSFQRVIFSKTWICHHSKKNKGSDSKRNAECTAKLKILIKKISPNTVRNDAFLKLNPPLVAEVTVSLNHSHNITSAETQGMLRVTKEVKEEFFEYFSNGMAPAEAIKFHENKFFSEEKNVDLANASLNPTLMQVHYLHKCWRSINVGSNFNPFEKLIEKIPFYESKGSIVKFDKEDPWAVVVVTSVMLRTQQLNSASEKIFVNSTCSCEKTCATLTVLLTVTKVGALPIAVLIHASQTVQNYISAFNLLKNNFPNCFGGMSKPSIFMTDDSSAEKIALKSVWPDSTQLLCHFHVAQAVWRWLFGHAADIPKEDRSRLMKLFLAVMYATSQQILDENIKDILAENTKFPKFVKRFFKFYERKTEWVLFYRSDLVTRQNNTNNYAEATIRILKDVVLCRTKAFNVVALVEFCISVWEKYLITKLLEFALSRRKEVYVLYSKFCRKTDAYSEENIKEIGDNLFLIKREENTSYTVDAGVGTCTCPSGISGAFCKHQFLLVRYQKMQISTAPPVSPEDKYKLACLALGEKCPPPIFFSGFKECPEDSCIIENDLSFTETNPNSPAIVRQPQNDHHNKNKSLASLKEKELFRKELERVSNLFLGDISNEENAKFLNVLKKINKSHDLKKVFFLTSKRKKINVQPTSISRRRPGLAKSSSKVPFGRPSLSLINKGIKRKRNLKANIELNRANAKSHGIKRIGY